MQLGPANMPCRWVCTGVRMKYCNSFGAPRLGQDALPIPHCAIAPKTLRRPGNARIRETFAVRVFVRVYTRYSYLRMRKRERRYDLRWISVNSFFRARFQRERQREMRKMKDREKERRRKREAKIRGG